MELLIRAVVLTVCVVLFTISLIVDPGRGFVWFLFADFFIAYRQPSCGFVGADTASRGQSQRKSSVR
jgi:hypothetical protein